jgi:hypothetical protein
LICDSTTWVSSNDDTTAKTFHLKILKETGNLDLLSLPLAAVLAL